MKKILNLLLITGLFLFSFPSFSLAANEPFVLNNSKVLFSGQLLPIKNGDTVSTQISQIVLEFNNHIDFSTYYVSVKDSQGIKPQIKPYGYENGSYIYIEAPLKKNETYTVSVQGPEIKDINGNVLKEPVNITFKTDDGTSSATPVFKVQEPSSFISNLTNYEPQDIDGHWAFETLADFVNADLLKGYSEVDGLINLLPDKSITRAEFVTILVRAMGLQKQPNAKIFTDVTSDQWYYDSVIIAASNGIVNGMSEKNFEPNREVRRDEIATMLVRAYENSIDFVGQPKQFTDVAIDWAKSYIDKASRAGIINGYTETEFKPSNKATRAEAVTMLSRALHLEKDSLPADKTLVDMVLDSESDYFEKNSVKSL